jgi:hypothetical protein
MHGAEHDTFFVGDCVNVFVFFIHIIGQYS